MTGSSIEYARDDVSQTCDSFWGFLGKFVSHILLSIFWNLLRGD